jgi:tetratricopeptide (TPR) repeat protein
VHVLRGEREAAVASLERALRLAETLSLEETLVQALTSRALVLLFEGRRVEARSLLETALARAETAELHAAWWRAANNLGVLLEHSEQYAEALVITGEIESQARRRGDREALAAARVGQITELRTAFAACEARLLRAQNRPAEALAAAERGLAHRELGIANQRFRNCLFEALEAALELDDLAKADELLTLVDTLQPGELTPSLQAQRHRFHARLDTSRGSHDQVDHNYCEAEAIFAQHGLAFHHAVTQLEGAEWLTSQGRGDEAQLLLAQARETFEQLEAKPWLERLATAEAATPTEMLA